MFLRDWINLIATIAILYPVQTSDMDFATLRQIVQFWLASRGITTGLIIRYAGILAYHYIRASTGDKVSSQLIQRHFERIRIPRIAFFPECRFRTTTAVS